VSGMGGLGKSTLVANVYDRVKNNSFETSAWIAVSQTYDIDALLRELLWKIGYTQITTSVSTDKMDTYMLKQEIRSRLQEGSGKCLVVLDDVWDKDVYEKIQDVFKNLPVNSCHHHDTERRCRVSGILGTSPSAPALG
jgi:disease resistance protein RPM1